jgi:hypothetical protein
MIGTTAMALRVRRALALLGTAELVMPFGSFAMVDVAGRVRDLAEV